MICTALQAQHDAAELITQREIVSLKCREALNARAKDFHIILDDISITHLTFGQEFTHAVELKQVAQQEAERARFLVERAEQEMRSIIQSGRRTGNGEATQRGRYTQSRVQQAANARNSRTGTVYAVDPRVFAN